MIDETVRMPHDQLSDQFHWKSSFYKCQKRYLSYTKQKLHTKLPTTKGCCDRDQVLATNTQQSSLIYISSCSRNITVLETKLRICSISSHRKPTRVISHNMDLSSHEAGLVPELIWMLWGRQKLLTCREPIQDNKIKQKRNTKWQV